MRASKESFKGEDVFVGIDVHKKSWQIGTYFLGTNLKSFQMNPDSGKLKSYLDKRYPGANFFSCYEAGFSGNWLHRELVDLGIENLIVHANDVPTTGKEKDRKSDPIDCRKLARALGCGLLKANYVPSIEQEGDRQLLRCWRSTLKDIRRMKHRIKSQLLVTGKNLPAEWDKSYWNKDLFSWLDQLDMGSFGGNFALKKNLERLQLRISKEKEMKAAVLALSSEERYSNNFKRIKTLPGFGLNISMNFLVELGDMNRFKNLDKLCSYIGLVPSTHSSGAKERVGELTGRTHKILLPLLIQASWVATRSSPEFRKYFYHQKESRKDNPAIIKVARKLLGVMRAVWMNQTEYTFTRNGDKT